MRAYIAIAFIVVGLFILSTLVYVDVQKTNMRAVSVPTTTDQQERIIIDTPSFGNVITSPVMVRGKARGSWFFEGTFPMELRDTAGIVIAQGYASVDEGVNWMTDDFVPFAGALSFMAPPGVHAGYIVFKRSNPSGLSEYEESVAIPVEF